MLEEYHRKPPLPGISISAAEMAVGGTLARTQPPGRALGE